MLNFEAGKQFKGIMDKVATFIAKELPAVDKSLADTELTVGDCREGKFGVPAYAKEQCLSMGVGDAKAWKGNLSGMTDELNQLSKTNPEQVGITPKFNSETNRYDFQAFKRGVGDTILSAQQMSPWNISFFETIAKKPLSYSYADRQVKKYAGSNPWATAMTLLQEDWAGAATITNAGSMTNNMDQDVQAMSDAMTSIIINAICSYSLTIEELERAKSSSNMPNPFAGRLITSKEKYVDYCLKLIRDVLIYYGNPASDTKGLLTVNSVTSFGGTSLANIAADAADDAKGNTIYNMIAEIIRDYLAAVDYKFNVVNFTMAPQAYGILSTSNYSTVYNPTPAIEILKSLLQTDLTKGGARQLKINFIVDPLLKAGSVFNSNVYDYMLLTSPEIEAGPDEEQQDLIYFGEPIENFVFPVVPGQTHTHYKKLKRMAGVFAPVPQAIKAYYGFGIDS